ncbi:hypothetical protein SCALM49S_04631 [Streptomyces californicus]
MPATPRRRPATRKGRPVLTREIIAAKALEMAGDQGFAALTMRALAAELDVTVRALYNHVEDRQDVVQLAVDALLTSWNPPPLHAATWQESVAAYAASLRALYRGRPRALLVSLDEDTPPASVHPDRENLDPAAGQPHGEGVLVAVAEPFAHGPAVLRAWRAQFGRPRPPHSRRRPSRSPCPRCPRRGRPRAAGALPPTETTVTWYGDLAAEAARSMRIGAQPARRRRRASTPRPARAGPRRGDDPVGAGRAGSRRPYAGGAVDGVGRRHAAAALRGRCTPTPSTHDGVGRAVAVQASPPRRLGTSAWVATW